MDVLNLEWTSSPARDRESATLVCNYLRMNGLSVLEKSIHNGFEYLRTTRPKVLVMTNTIGSVINVKVAAFAKSRGIPVIATISEGLFYDRWIEMMFWGANRTGELMEDVRLLWSDVSRRHALTVAPEYEGRLKVAGSVGADRFVITDERGVWLENDSPRKTVVGVGCFDFGFVQPSHGYHSFMNAVMGPDGIERYARDRDLFNDALLEIIRRNPDCIFVLKEHPGAEESLWRSGIEGASAFANVVVIRDEHSLVQCIAVSDVWVSYESTTALEAWLMGKQTGIINPTGTDLPNRHMIWEGQPNYPSAAEFQTAIEAFKARGYLPGFAELSEQRKQIIEHVIQWSDGLNHVRVGNEVIEFLERGVEASLLSSTASMPTPRELLRRRLSWLKVQAAGKLARRVSFVRKDRRFWDERELGMLADLRMRQQRQHYVNCGLDLRHLRSIRAV